MDTPQVTPDAARRGALDALATRDAVLGAGADGGYWGIGLRSPDPRASSRRPDERRRHRRRRSAPGCARSACASPSPAAAASTSTRSPTRAPSPPRARDARFAARRRRAATSPRTWPRERRARRADRAALPQSALRPAARTAAGTPGTARRRGPAAPADGRLDPLPLDAGWPVDAADESVLAHAAARSSTSAAARAATSARSRGAASWRSGSTPSPAAVRLARAAARDVDPRLASSTRCPAPAAGGPRCCSTATSASAATPVALLARVGELLAPGGAVLVEVEPPGTPTRTGTACASSTPGALSAGSRWARVGVDDLHALAGAAGLSATRPVDGGRTLVRRADAERRSRSRPGPVSPGLLALAAARPVADDDRSARSCWSASTIVARHRASLPRGLHAGLLGHNAIVPAGRDLPLTFDWPTSPPGCTR